MGACLQRERGAQVDAPKALPEAGRRRQGQPRVALKPLQPGSAADEHRLRKKKVGSTHISVFPAIQD